MSVRALRRGSIAASRATASTATALSLPGTSGNYVSTPDAAGSSALGDFEVIMRLSLPDWTPATGAVLAAKRAGAGQREWHFLILSAGTFQFELSMDGTNNAISVTTSAANSFTNGQTYWLNVRRFSASVEVYTSPDGASPSWSKLGNTLTGAGGNAFNSTTAVTFGANGLGNSPLIGVIRYAELRSGVGGAGSNIHTFDAAPVTILGTRNPSTVSAGGPWTVNGSAWDWTTV